MKGWIGTAVHVFCVRALVRLFLLAHPVVEAERRRVTEDRGRTCKEIATFGGCSVTATTKMCAHNTIQYQVLCTDVIFHLTYLNLCDLLRCVSTEDQQTDDERMMMMF